MLIMPLVIYYLSVDELNAWFQFWTLYTLTVLLEFGLQQVSTIYLSKSYKTINGIPQVSAVTLRSVSKLYKLIGLIQVVFVFPASLAFFAISNIDINEKLFYYWMFFFASAVLQTYTNYIISFYKSIGNLDLSNYYQIASRSIFLLLSLVLLDQGYGLSGLIVAHATSVALVRIQLLYDYKKKVTRHTSKDVNCSFQALFLLEQSWKIGVMQFSGLITQRVPILLAGMLLSVTESAQVGFLISMLIMFQSLSGSIGNVYLPRLSALFQEHKYDEIRFIVVNMYVFSISTFAFFLTILELFSGYFHFLSASADSYFLESYSLIFGAIYFIELVHIVPVTILMAFGETAFLKRSILTGVVFLLITYCSFSLGNFYLFSFLAILCHVGINTFHWNRRLLRIVLGLRGS